MRNAGGNRFAAAFGSVTDCGNVPNRFDIVNGWNCLMRVYPPELSVLEGHYELPEVEPIVR